MASRNVELVVANDNLRPRTAAELVEDIVLLAVGALVSGATYAAIGYAIWRAIAG
jgi:hypothetical protein